MKKLNKNDLKIVAGASQNDRDIAQLTGTLIGGGIGHVTKIPGGQAVGSAVGSYLGGGSHMIMVEKLLPYLLML